ncbi:MAG TPA: hypothetical protein IAB17_01020 [Candidatus Alectryocaccobium stercorigallinarum]|nr:hypothetical protein [Candidatus Alectryocaccobium stercorigallinarum]
MTDINTLNIVGDKKEKNTAVSDNVAEALFSLLDDSGNEVILDENGQIPSLQISGGGLIPLKEWAARNGISPATARQKAGRGAFLTARKVGRDWMISAAEPNPDHRIKLPQKEKLSPSDPVYMYKLLNYLYRLNLGNLPDTVNENKSHINYCKRLFMQIRNNFSGNTLKLFDLICDKMAVQEGADAYYIPHEEIMSVLDDEAWHTENNGSSSNSAVTIDFKDYLNILKNTASDMLSRCVELKVNHQTQTVFMPWYHSLSWENTRQGGLYFIPNNFFKMIILELN